MKCVVDKCNNEASVRAVEKGQNTCGYHSAVNSTYCSEENCTSRVYQKSILKGEFKCPKHRIYYCIEENCENQVKSAGVRCRKCASSGSRNGTFEKSVLDIWILKHGIEIAEQMWIERNNKISETQFNKGLTGELHWNFERISSDETKNKISEGLKKFYQDGGITTKGRVMGEEEKAKRSLSAAKSLCNRKYQTTKCELEMEQLLIECNINFKKQFFILDEITNRYSVYDFLLIDYNILIEVDGNYWHCREGYKNHLTGKRELPVIIIKIMLLKTMVIDRIVRVWEDEVKLIWRLI